MLILKHLEYRIKDGEESDDLLSDLHETTSRVPGVTLRGICFPGGKKGFVVILR
jgi:hypothetical protein